MIGELMANAPLCAVGYLFPKCDVTLSFLS